MGQEQSYVAHRGAQVRRYADKINEPVRSKSDSRSNCDEYKRYKARRSPDSNSNSSNESSGYRSGSSAYDFRSDRSSKSEYYCTSLYKNDHYKDVNKELYKPVKITKEKRYKVQLFEVNDEEIKSARLKGYLTDAEKAKLKAGPTPKKAGIRNYTPKILSEDEQRLKIEGWI
ncbi:uncharacterized protein LOC106709880 [Papilio machaon]|uniref:uncharacterized protein LOC106709880 n=1 Tax=Papilio machaon TaxID=76193 RepID=UPI001E6652E2|nr:uncharacterized protein LOC106709880 [Papilio machaon]